MFRFASVLMGALLLLAHPTEASDPKPPGLLFEGKPLHPGCVSELTTDATGDNVVKAVHLISESLRGCRDSNRYSTPTQVEREFLAYTPPDVGGRFGYRVHRKLDENTYVLETRVESTGTYVGRGFLFVRIADEAAWIVENGKAVKKTVKVLMRLGEVMTTSEAELVAKALKPN